MKNLLDKWVSFIFEDAYVHDHTVLTECLSHQFLCTHTHTHIHTQIHTHIHTHIHIYAHIDNITHTHAQIHTHIHTHIHTVGYTVYSGPWPYHTHWMSLSSAPLYTHTYTHTCTHTYTHAYIHTYIHSYKVYNDSAQFEYNYWAVINNQREVLPLHSHLLSWMTL